MPHPLLTGAASLESSRLLPLHSSQYRCHIMPVRAGLAHSEEARVVVLLTILGCIGSLKPGDAQLLETAGTLCGLGLFGSSMYGQHAARMHQAQCRRGPRQCKPQQIARMAIVPWIGDRAQASACCCRRHLKSQSSSSLMRAQKIFWGARRPHAAGSAWGRPPPQ